MAETQPQHLIELKASNFKRLSAVRIAADPKNPNGVIVLTGENAAGKSSVLDAITAALLGERYAPDKPIKTGATKAKILLKTEDFVVTRTFTESGGTLKVEDREGRSFSTPQKLLDRLCSVVGFDPLSFARMKPKEQVEELLRICPIELDLDANAAEHKAAYEERRELNRLIKDIESKLATLPETDPTLPDVEVSISALAEEASKASAKINEYEKVLNGIAAAELNITNSEEKLAELKREIAKVEAGKAKWEEHLAKLKSVPNQTAEYEAEAKRLQEQMRTAELKNELIRKQAQRKRGEALLTAKQDLQRTAEKKLEHLAEQRQNALQNAKFPVDGLSISDEGEVVFKGVPFSQASTAEQIKVGVALAAASNPKLKLAFVRDGSLLDSKSMTALAEISAQHGLQVLIERVDDKTPGAVEIVDGATVGATADTEEEPVAKKATKAAKGDLF
jgi:DNA repair exonuclease SbcCD ATPase subunit